MGGRKGAAGWHVEREGVEPVKVVERKGVGVWMKEGRWDFGLCIVFVGGVAVVGGIWGEDGC